MTERFGEMLRRVHTHKIPVIDTETEEKVGEAFATAIIPAWSTRGNCCSMMKLDDDSFVKASYYPEIPAIKITRGVDPFL